MVHTEVSAMAIKWQNSANAITRIDVKFSWFRQT